MSAVFAELELCDVIEKQKEWRLGFSICFMIYITESILTLRASSFKSAVDKVILWGFKLKKISSAVIQLQNKHVYVQIGFSCIIFLTA